MTLKLVSHAQIAEFCEPPLEFPMCTSASSWPAQSSSSLPELPAASPGSALVSRVTIWPVCQARILPQPPLSGSGGILTRLLLSFFHSSALAPQAFSCLMRCGHLPAGPLPIPRSQGELTSSKLRRTLDIPGEFQRCFPLRGFQGDVHISQQEQVSSRICFSLTFSFRAHCFPFHVIHTSHREPTEGQWRPSRILNLNTRNFYFEIRSNLREKFLGQFKEILHTPHLNLPVFNIFSRLHHHCSYHLPTYLLISFHASIRIPSLNKILFKVASLINFSAYICKPPPTNQHLYRTK